MEFKEDMRHEPPAGDSLSPSGRDEKTGKFRHPLKEGIFQAWYKYHAKNTGISPNPDELQHHYDYRAAFEKNQGPDATGHWPAEYRKATHPKRFIRTQTEHGIQVYDTATGRRYIEE